MAWTDPRTWATGEVVTAALMNTHVRDNLNQCPAHIVTTAGDIVYATGDSALARLALGTGGYILHVGGSSAPAWTNSPSISGITLSGVLDANGSIDFDGTTAAFDGSGAITLTSTSTSANGIHLRANGGTSETIKIHSDQGTSVTEGGASVQLLSDAGGIGIKSTANLASAILLTADGGTSETIVIHSDQGSGVGSITLLSDAGGITLNANGAVAVTNTLTVGGAVTVGVDDTGHDVKFFGASAGAFMLYDQSEDQLVIMGASADATTSTGKLLLATSLANVNANDVIGKIDFQAPSETGTDAITIAASIQAIAQGTFSASVNATDLIFSTGHSEAATEKFRITSQGELGVGGANYGTDGQVLTSGGAGAAPAWENAGGLEENDVIILTEIMMYS